MNRKVITVPELNAPMLKIGDDMGGLGANDYVIEEIGEPFTDEQGHRVIEVTLVKLPPGAGQ